MKQTTDIMTDTNISEEQSCSTACHTKTQSDAMVFRTDEIVTKPIEVKASDMVRPKERVNIPPSLNTLTVLN